MAVSESEAMTNRQMDAAVAERIMGLAIFTATPKQTAISGGCKVAHSAWLDTGERHEWGPVVKRIPFYSTDRTACAEMEARLKATGNHREYAAELYEVCGGSLLDNRLDFAFALATASPAQRVMAALKALTATGERTKDEDISLPSKPMV